MKLFDKILGISPPILNHWGYWVIFFATMLEALPIGFLIPGHVIVIIGGFLAKIGILGFYEVILIASFGAVLGDIINYFIGNKYGYGFIKRYGKYFFLKKENYEKTKKLMNKHTGKTVIIGRFNPITRSFAPFIAGSTNVPFFRFIIYNMIGGVAWVISAVLIGYIFGKSYETGAKYFGEFMIIAIALSIVIIYLYNFVNKRKHIFSRYHLYSLILNIFSLYVFSKMVEDVLDNEMVVSFDLWVNSKMALFWSPGINKIMTLITNIVSPVGLFGLSMILLGILIYRKRWYFSILLFCSLIGGLILELLIKLIIHRARPTNALIDISGSSFPSGHATMSIIFFSMIIYSLKDDINNRFLKNGFIFINLLMFIIIGFSRIYLNVHWFSDVIAGFSLGIFWLTLLILILKVIMSLGKKGKNIIINYVKLFK